MAKLFRAAIMGPPGSGKGTISRRIAQSFGLQYLSSGHYLGFNLLRPRFSAGVLVKTYVERGMLVPDHVMTRLMLPRLEQVIGHSWLLDGFPRTLPQARELNNLCQLDMVINLTVPFETLKDRLSERWVHPASGRVYNMGFNPPLVEGRDDITGEPLIHHDDDKPEALMARLRIYKDVAKPVIDFYKSLGILHSFSGTDTDRIWPYINTVLTNKMDTPHSDARQTQTP
uniref:GTP:AMP phosphotransferase AK3, mitochondrial n=1 Tax=Sphaeramia orbicularis TaxID=375764 RepID=A0A672Z517_9TELE